MSESNSAGSYYYSVGDGGVSIIEPVGGVYRIAHFRNRRFEGYRSKVPDVRNMKPCYVISLAGYLLEREGTLVADSPEGEGVWLPGTDMMKILDKLKGKDRHRLTHYKRGETTGDRISQVFLVFDEADRQHARGLLEGILSCAK